MKYGVDMQPTDRWFSWALRHAAFLLNAYSKTEAGLTPFEAVSGKAEPGELAEFGETVLMEVSNDLVKGKTAMRRIKGMWVGIQPNNRGHMVLTNSGVNVSRVVKRVHPRRPTGREHVRASARTPIGA